MEDKRAEYLDMLREVFIKVFNDESIILNNSTNAEDIDEWDSLQHIMLIMGAEKKFGLKLTAEEVAELKNVGEMIDLVIKKLC